MRLLGILIIIYLPIYIAYNLTPSSNPLQYIQFPVIIDWLTESSKQLIQNGLLPVDGTDAVAIFISEGVSGALGGVAAKGISIIDGNKLNKEKFISSAEVSGA